MAEHDDNLPAMVQVAQQEAWPVVQVRSVRGSGAKSLGCLDTKRRRIEIKRNQPKVGKHIILLHELIHLCVENCIEAGLVKEQEEALVENLAGGLLPMLALSGLWKGLTKREVRKFYGMINMERVSRRANARQLRGRSPNTQ